MKYVALLEQITESMMSGGQNGWKTLFWHMVGQSHSSLWPNDNFHHLPWRFATAALGMNPKRMRNSYWSERYQIMISNHTNHDTVSALEKWIIIYTYELSLHFNSVIFRIKVGTSHHRLNFFLRCYLGWFPKFFSASWMILIVTWYSNHCKSNYLVRLVVGLSWLVQQKQDMHPGSSVPLYAVTDGFQSTHQSRKMTEFNFFKLFDHSSQKFDVNVNTRYKWKPACYILFGWKKCQSSLWACLTDEVRDRMWRLRL